MLSIDFCLFSINFTINKVSIHPFIVLNIILISFSERIVGYVSDVTSITPSKDRKRKLFIFKISNNESEHSFVCFSPEKYRFVSNLATEKNQSIGCEIIQYRLPTAENGHLVVGDYTKIKRTKLSFDYAEHEREFLELIKVNNECNLYEEVNVKGKISDLKDPVEKLNMEISYSLRHFCLMEPIP